MNNWTSRLPTVTDAHRRASGRRRVNAQRKAEKNDRQLECLHLAIAYHRKGIKLSDRGIQSRIARELGLARSTVCQYFRDLQPVLTMLEGMGDRPFRLTVSGGDVIIRW